MAEKNLHGYLFRCTGFDAHNMQRKNSIKMQNSRKGEPMS